ncbi:sigma factor-like helix-turn-helix DNA-binding protein, partial [Acinetobacter baumannii]
YRIVRNLALDWGRRLSAERRRADGGAILDDIPASAASPEQAACDRDELRIVAAALAELPERTQRVFEMHRLDGRTLQEVA